VLFSRSVRAVMFTVYVYESFRTRREVLAGIPLAAGAKSLSGESMLELATASRKRTSESLQKRVGKSGRSLSWHSYYFRQARVSARYPRFPTSSRSSRRW